MVADMMWADPEPLDAAEKRVLKAYLVLLSQGAKPTHKQLRMLALVGGSTTVRCMSSLQEKGWLIGLGDASDTLFRVHPKAWTELKVRPPTWKGAAKKLDDVRGTARETYKQIEHFFAQYHHVPGPTDLAPIIGHTRQRAHQVLMELRRKGALPPKTEVTL